LNILYFIFLSTNTSFSLLFMVVDISREVYPFRFVLLGFPALLLYPSYYYNYYFFLFILVFYTFYPFIL